MDAQLSRELNEISMKFKDLIKDMKGSQLKRILNQAAEPIVQIARAKAPRSKRTHYRYNTPKLVRKLRAPNGTGVVVAAYTPGNTKRAIQKLVLRRLSKSAVLIGPKIAKNDPDGRFSSNEKVDGFYARFTDQGTKKQRAQGYMKAAAVAGRPVALKIFEQKLSAALKRKLKQQGFGNR